MPIPPGTRFHGVAPSVDVQDRGSASRNALRETYAIEEFGGSPFEFNGDIPASGVLTFTDQPSDGDTITVGGVVITFRNTLTGSGDEVRIQSNLNTTITRLRDYFNNNYQSFTAYFTVSTNTPVYGVKLNTTSLKIVHFEGGTVGNSVTTTSSGANFSWGAPTLEGGTNGTSAVTNDSGNVCRERSPVACIGDYTWVHRCPPVLILLQGFRRRKPPCNIQIPNSNQHIKKYPYGQPCCHNN